MMMAFYKVCCSIVFFAAGINKVTAQTSDLDIAFIVDTSLSFDDDLERFKLAVTTIIDGTSGLSPDTRYGLANFEDYPTLPFGRPGIDKEYTRVQDLTNDTAAFITKVSSLEIGNGNDEPESQLRAVEQAIQSTNPQIRMNFRPAARKVIVLWTDSKFHSKETTVSTYPGPSFSAVINNLQNSSVTPPYVLVGLNRDGEGGDTALGTSDLRRLANATKSFAASNVNCGSGGGGIIASDEILICTKVGGTQQAIEEGFVNIIVAGANAETMTPIIIPPAVDAVCDFTPLLAQVCGVYVALRNFVIGFPGGSILFVIPDFIISLFD